jgi:hypothetical protein
MSFRGGRPSRQRGFYDDMSDRPMHSTRWHAVVLVPANPAARGGMLTQTFNAIVYRGKDFRVQARLRLDPKDPKDIAQLWLRVDRPSDQFDMSDCTVRATEWSSCEITDRIADDAEYVNINIVSIGNGNARTMTLPLNP